MLIAGAEDLRESAIFWLALILFPVVIEED